MKPSRRDFVKVIGAGVSACAFPKSLHAAGLPSRRKRHIFTLSFDDGLEKSCLKTADIYEKHGFSACLRAH